MLAAILITFSLMLAPALRAQTNQASKEEIRRIAGSGHLEDLQWPNFSDYRAIVVAFYQPAYQPAWLKDGNPSPQAIEMIHVLQSADQEGLRPDDYDGSRWSERLQKFPQLSPVDRAKFDVALTVCAMRYVSDLHMGRVNPQHFDFAFDEGAKKLDLARLFRTHILNSDDLRAEILAMEPPFEGYRRTRAALQDHMDLEQQYREPPLPLPQGMLLDGGAYPGAAQLGRLLKVLGDLPADSPAPRNPNTYQEPLVSAVQRFQIRHGITPHGIIDQQTIAALNVPLSKRVEQLQLALERWRWLPYKFPSPPLVVNVPEFRLRAFDASGKVALSMKVNVGEAYSTETPMFESDMKYVVFRPYWDVPPNIQRKELVIDIAEDPKYLSFNNFEVIGSDGKALTNSIVNPEILSALRSGRARLRQKPGPGNALGLVKFIFPNSHSVYLHDTDLSDDMFHAARRDFSHGCIHVEKPADLAAWVLRNNPDWNLQRVQEAMHTGKDNFRVNLAVPIPVLLIYGTAVVDESGKVFFYPDIYGLDAQLSEALAKGHPYR